MPLPIYIILANVINHLSLTYNSLCYNSLVDMIRLVKIKSLQHFDFVNVLNFFGLQLFESCEFATNDIRRDNL